MSWTSKEIREVCELFYGKSLPDAQRTDGEYPVYGSAGIVGYHNKYIVEGPGIIIGRKGSVGTVYYSKQNFFPIDTVYFVVPNKSVDLRFLYYKLLTLNLSHLNTDAAVPGLNRNVVHEQISHYPDMPTQKRIARILSVYDDLIENNLKRIKLLEESANLGYQAIHNRTNSYNFRKIKVCEILCTIKRKPKIQTSDYQEKGNYPIVDQSTNFICGYTDVKDTVYSEPLPIIIFGDHTRILKFVNFPFACGADGTQLIYPNRAAISVAYLYFQLKNLNLANYHYARHFKFLKDQYIYLPADEVMSEYKRSTDPCFALIHILREQNRKLAEARDILLPRLMNGEITV